MIFNFIRALDQRDYHCLNDKYLTELDRVILWLGGILVMFATTILIIGSIRFKELRKQPGDLIIGIALSDLVLAIYWIIVATWDRSVDNPTFCKVTGAIGTFAALTEYLYNAAFSLYLILSLKFVMTPDRVPKKLFHILCLGLSAVYLLLLHLDDEIGKTLVGTCSIRSTCDGAFSNYLSSILIACYGLIGIYTFTYVRKNAPKCKQANTKRADFLLYYLKYIVAAASIYGIIGLTSILSTLFEGDVHAINSLYNLSRICCPIVLTIIRFKDPIIRSAMIRTIKFWKKDKSPRKINEKLVEKIEPSGDVPTEINQIQEMLPNNLELSQNEFMFNQLSSNRKIEVTYTLLSSIMYADFSQRNSVWNGPSADSKKMTGSHKVARDYVVGDGAIRYLIPSVQDELDKTNYSILSGSLKVYAPEVFTQFIDDERGLLNIQESLDFIFNREQIKDAYGPGGGKSGEFFFFTRDKKLIIKTIPNVEMQMLISILGSYDQHFRENPNSLIAKIYGAYTFESTEYDLKLNFIVMKNICGFPSRYVERTYDMKGSKYDREVLKNNANIDKSALRSSGVLKDLDFERFEQKLYIDEKLKNEFIKQVEADSLFFKKMNLIDYSFMVFCVNKQQYMFENGIPQDMFTAKNHLASLVNMQEAGVFYNVGIVDYLQPYNMQKAFEKIVKKTKKFNMALDTSSQDPIYYSNRFIEFIKKLVN